MADWTKAPVGDVWTIERRVPQGWGWRSAAVRLADGGLVVVGPLRALSDAAHAELAAIGATALLLAPNHFHHMGLGETVARNPSVTVVASDRARGRVAGKSKLPVGDVAGLTERLPTDVTVLVPEGTKNGEAWLSVRAGGETAWIVSDAFFHLEERPTGAMGAFLRWTKTAPGLTIGDTFRWIALADRARYAAWLKERILAERPTVLVPGHGAILRDPALPERLLELAERRL